MHLDYSNISLSKINAGTGLDTVASMRMMIIMRERKKQVAQMIFPERLLNNKIEAYKFIDLLKIRRPRVITGKAMHDDLPDKLEKVVIKPVSGRSSRGVYAVFNENVIKQVKTAEVFSGRQALIDLLRSDLQSGVVKEDRWIIEELIVEDDDPLVAARDLKFYCFYGRVELCVETIRDPETRYCLWDKDCKLKDVGTFKDQLFVGRGFTPEMQKIAEGISAEIPAPFLRIDFHSTGSNLVFCEFTPTSGGIWDYGRETDQFLGERYLEAEARLLEDMLNGKKFETYNSFYKNYFATRKPAKVEKSGPALH
jgi:hypothetical protein